MSIAPSNVCFKWWVISCDLRSPRGRCFRSPVLKVAMLYWQLMNAMSCTAALPLLPWILNIQWYRPLTSINILPVLKRDKAHQGTYAIQSKHKHILLAHTLAHTLVHTHTHTHLQFWKSQKIVKFWTLCFTTWITYEGKLSRGRLVRLWCDKLHKYCKDTMREDSARQANLERACFTQPRDTTATQFYIYMVFWHSPFWH